MEAINIQKFRELKKQIIDTATEMLKVQDNGDIERDKELLEKYNSLIAELASYDLSIIDYDEWEGLYLIQSGTNLDFSKTGAKIDFSKIIFYSNESLSNFQSCKIRNFDFEKNQYTNTMFDKDFISKNPQFFIISEIPEDVENRFYNGEIQISDIKKYPEIKEKVKAKNIEYRFRNLFELIDIEEFSKLDDEFLRTTGYIMWSDIITSIPKPRNAKTIMDTLYRVAREKILKYNYTESAKERFYFNQNKLGKEFKKLNADLFLDEDVPQNIREEYYGHYLTLETYSKNLQYFKDKKVAQAFNGYHNEKAIVNMYGDEIYDLFSKYKILMDRVLNSMQLPDEAITTYFNENNRKKMMQKIMSIYATKEIEDFEIIYLLMDFIPPEKINLGVFKDLKADFINKYGRDNIIRLDKDSQGLFSRKDQNGQTLFTMLAKEESKAIGKIGTDIDYDTFCENIYRILRKIRGSKTTNENLDYEFIQGDFRKKYADIFLDEEISPDLCKKFYTGTMSPEDVKQNPELIEILVDKDLTTTFKTTMNLIGEQGVKNKEGKSIGISQYEINMAEYITDRFGKKVFLQLCKEYGKGLDFDTITIKENMNEEQIRTEIEETIYKFIIEHGLEYDDKYPDSFKKKHLDLFLPKSVDDDIRKKFYSGKIDYDDIRENPEIKKIIRNKNLSVGMAEVKYRESEFIKGKRELCGIWKDNRFTEEEILDLAEKYGMYLQNIETWRIYGDESYFEKEQIIKEQITSLILERKLPYNENIPQFFKDEYSKYFLDKDAPEELKLRFYDGISANQLIEKHSKSDLEKRPELGYLSLKILSQHPEWQEFIKGKVLKRAFPEEYTYLASIMGEEKFLKLGLRYPEIVEKMIEIGNEDTLIEWYNATGEKYIPSFYVMQTFPTDEIDKFLKNSKKWSQLTRRLNVQEDDNSKLALLKVAYTMGIFEGEDEAYTNVRKLFMEIPELSIEKLHHIFDSFAMKYNADFSKFFMNNLKQIINNDENEKIIASVQRRFDEIQKFNSGRILSLDNAIDYINNFKYSNVEVGNEKLADLASKVGYSQEDFEYIQELYNEGVMREYSSIPHFEGEYKGYSYEMLKCDDPLALVIGPLTECCQEKNGAGQTSMEHSVLSQDGRVFVVKDEKGRIVAQSWFWKNQYTGCFDNIEIPDRIFKMYKKEHPKEGKEGLTKKVLEVYKIATQELMKIDKNSYDRLLQQGSITQDEYDSLMLGRVTVGLGYNDIANAIQNDDELRQTEETILARPIPQISNIYTDAKEQYTLSERDGIKKSNYDNLYVYQDDISVYDSTDFPDSLLTMMKRMEKDRNQKRFKLIEKSENEDGSLNSQKIIDDIAMEYNINPESTQIMATSRIVIIYSKEENITKIADIVIAQPNENSRDEYKTRLNKHISSQIKKAMQQLLKNTQGYIDTSMLNDKQKELLDNAVEEIQKEEGSER